MVPSRLPPATVLIPGFNEERVLAGTVRSVLASDHPDLEVIIIDDGSTDGTLRVAEELAREHSNVRVVALGRNRGKAAALNAGMRAASHDIVVTVDADTVLAQTPCGCSSPRSSTPATTRSRAM